MYPVSITFALVAFILVLCAAQGVRMISYDAVQSLSMDENAIVKEKGSLIVKFVDKAGLRFGRLLSGVYSPRRRARLENRLKRAGYPAGLTQRKFIQRETGFIILGGVFFLFCVLIDELIIGIGFGLLLASWMQIWLTNTGLRRSRQIDRDLPDFLDVLSVTVRSGMSFRPAVERVSSFHEGPLAEEMKNAIHSMRLGVTRREAFIAARDNSRSEKVAIFVSAFLQAEELGTPLADALVDISSEIRRERAQQVRRAAARAQPKIAMVVTTMILPATLILILGSMILMNAAPGIGN